MKSPNLSEALKEQEAKVNRYFVRQQERQPRLFANARLLLWLVFSFSLLLLVVTFFFLWNIFSLAISRANGGQSHNFTAEGLISAFNVMTVAGLVIGSLIVVVCAIYYLARRLRHNN